MTIWICNPFDEPPGDGIPVLRYWSLAQAFVDAGHDVVWWSADWSHLYKTQRAPVSEHTGFSVRLISVRPYYQNISVRRFLSHSDYAQNLVQAGETAVENGDLDPPDWVIASLPPLGTLPAVAGWKQKWGTRLGLDIMDAWPEVFEQLFPGIVPSCLRRLCLHPLKRNANRSFQLADRISAAGETYLQLARQQAPETPTHLCYHGVNRNTVDRVASATPNAPSNVHLLHLGAMNRGYDVYTPLEALCEPGAETWELHYAGKGNLVEALKQRCEELGVSYRVHFHAQLTPGEVRDLMGGCTLGIVSNRPASWVACPYKAAEYAAAGLPILSCLGGEFDRLLREHPLGLSYAEGNSADFARAVREALQREWRITLPDIFKREHTYPALVSFYETERGFLSAEV